jgi:diguanylate cyclase (GGDEF)-like protein/PAS domain S-box-containing protein
MNCLNPPITLARPPTSAIDNPAVPAMLQTLLDGLLDATLLVDAAEQTVLTGNPAAAELWGAPLATLRGRAVLDLLASPEDACFWIEAGAHASARSLHSDSLMRRHDGSTCEVERRISTLTLSDGRPTWLVSLHDLSARRAIEAELDRLAEELTSALDCSTDALLVTDLDGAVRHCNRTFVQLWQLPDEIVLSRDDRRLHQHLQACLLDDAGTSPATVAPTASANTALSNPESSTPQRLQLRDGRTLERRVLPQYGRGAPVGRVLAFRDISRELADQTRLQLAAQVFEASQDAIYITDAQHRIVAVNSAGAELAGRTAAALQDLSLAELLHDPADPDTVPLLLGELRYQGQWQGELALQSHSDVHPVSATLLDIRDDGPTPAGCIAVLRDRSEQLAQQDALRELACRDILTGLPNRQRLNQRLGSEILDCERSGSHLALLLIGLDRFSQLNDSLGPAVGDQVLAEVARRLSACVRPGDTVARLGGDTFAVLLQHAQVKAAEQVASRMLLTLAEGMAVDGVPFNLSASIGAALYPDDGRKGDDLLKNADSAMHRIKQRNGNELCFYQPQMNTELLARLQLDHAMRQALRHGHFRLHYQPQIDLHTGRLIGCEALLRWHDPQLGDIAPSRFIPVAEETGFIAELGDWVLQEAVQQAAAWRRQGLCVPVAVNVSALQFQQAGLVDRVSELLIANDLPADQLELELTESVLLGDIHEILGELHRLAASGVRLAIDDFGTGYSGLGYLKRLPIHRLKIDRCFVDQLPDDASDAAIVRSVIEMAHALKLDVIAEGVETEAQRRFLAEAGCQSYQGWLYAPALSADEFARRAGLVQAQAQVA